MWVGTEKCKSVIGSVNREGVEKCRSVIGSEQGGEREMQIYEGRNEIKIVNL